MTWHVPDINKRLVIVLKIDFNDVTQPTEQVIEYGLWTFVLR